MLLNSRLVLNHLDTVYSTNQLFSNCTVLPRTDFLLEGRQAERWLSAGGESLTGTGASQSVVLLSSTQALSLLVTTVTLSDDSCTQ
jgi:hypothetical protein